MEETKTTLEVYQKFQKAVDLIEEKFCTGKGKQSFPRYVLAINNKCRGVVCAFVQNNALFDKSNGDKIQYLGINPRYLALCKRFYRRVRRLLQCGRILTDGGAGLQGQESMQ